MKKYFTLSGMMIAVALALIPSAASAATVYIESSRNAISVGDTAVITVRIDAEGAILNTVDGEIALKSPSGALTVQEFSLANSSFGLWPRTPSLSTDGATISFVGGVPGGFSIEGATLFKIIVRGKAAGSVTIEPRNLSVFANDGNGTKVPVKIRNATLAVSAKQAGMPVTDDWVSIVAGDTTAPADFIIILGQDSTLFGGKKFAFFSAVDNQSGIDHYEVSENGAPAVRSGSTYVLQDQSGNAVLNVTAYDKAGNKTSASSAAPRSSDGFWTVFTILVFIILIVLAIIMYRKSKKRTITPNVQPTI